MIIFQKKCVHLIIQCLSTDQMKHVYSLQIGLTSWYQGLVSSVLAVCMFLHRTILSVCSNTEPPSAWHQHSLALLLSGWHETICWRPPPAFFLPSLSLSSLYSLFPPHTHTHTFVRSLPLQLIWLLSASSSRPFLAMTDWHAALGYTVDVYSTKSES